MEEDNKPPKKIITVIKKEENKTIQVDEKNNFLVDPLETNNRMEKGMIKRLEEVENSFNSLLEKLNKQITLQEQKNQDLHQENNKLVESVREERDMREKLLQRVFSIETEREKKNKKEREKEGRMKIYRRNLLLLI